MVIMQLNFMATLLHLIFFCAHLYGLNMTSTWTTNHTHPNHEVQQLVENNRRIQDYPINQVLHCAMTDTDLFVLLHGSV